MPDLMVAFKNGGAGTAELGAEVGRFDAEFLNGVHRGQDDEVGSVEEVHSVRVVINPVEEVIVLRGAQAVGGERASGGVAAGVCLRRVDAGAELSKEGEVATVQGEIVHGLRVCNLTDGGALRFEQRSGGGDFDGLGDVAGFQCEILNHVHTDIDDDALRGDRLESLERDCPTCSCRS